ncbi:predicted protein [Odoribacter sp. CAG:788]|jgi:hypothetical protein|nr:predicted protein [Odoribacter sp. CAG:788]
MRDNQNSIAVIAFKFNDIFYSLATEELNNSGFKILILLLTENMSSGSFPCQNKFDKVIKIYYRKNFLFFFFAWLQVLWKLKKHRVEKVLLSNPILVINQLIISKLKANKIIFLEDGLMNYFPFSPPRYKVKTFVQKIFCLEDDEIFNRIEYTYLLKPDEAVFYKGTPRKLHLNEFIDEQSHRSLRGQLKDKAVFAGQPLYNIGIFSIEEYNEAVNKLIQKYNIDYYIPHPFSSEKEKIDCPYLDLNKEKVTLEVLAYDCNFTVYSFGSSISYTTKLINPCIKSILFKPRQWSNRVLDMITRHCDQVISL